MQSYDLADRARLALVGPDRARFLHGMVTCDVEKLVPGAGSRAAMLSVKGRLLAELTVYALADELLISLDRSLLDKVRGLFDKHIVMDDVEVAGRDEIAERGVYGDDAARALAGALGADAAALAALPPYHHLLAGEVRVAADPTLGGIGFRLLGAADRLAAAGGDPMTAEEHEVRRVEAGTPRYGVDLDEERLIVEANLDDAISFDKGCYLGQEVVVRATSRGRVNRRQVGLVVSGQGALPAGAVFSSAAREAAAHVTSSVVSQRMGGPIALAYVHREAIDGAQVISLVGGDRRAVPVALPFDAAAAAAARATLG